MAELWHQQTEETDQAFVRFLFFLNLGPTRSVQKAYNAYVASNNSLKAIDSPGGAVVQPGGNLTVIEAPKHAELSRKNISGAWQDDCVRNHWHYRASAYDKYHLMQMGKSVINDFYRAFESFAKKTADAIELAKFPSPEMADLRANLTLLAGYVGADAVDSYLGEDDSQQPDQ